MFEQKKLDVLLVFLFELESHRPKDRQKFTPPNSKTMFMMQKGADKRLVDKL